MTVSEYADHPNDDEEGGEPETPSRFSALSASFLDSAAWSIPNPMHEIMKEFADAQAAQIQNILKPVQWWNTIQFTPQLPETLGLAAQIGKMFEAYRPALLDNASLFTFKALSVDMGDRLRTLFQLPDLSQYFRDVTSSWLTPELLEGLRNIGRIGRPDNWDDTVGLGSAMDLVAAGWPIVWVPRSEIVVELINADDDDARSSLLVSHAEEILDDCEEALGAIDTEELQKLCGFASEASVAARQNLHRAAQATANVVVESAWNMHWKNKTPALRQKTVEDLGEIPISRFLPALCLAVLGSVYARFKLSNGDAVPGSYNRHASAHTVSDIQFTESNAIRAVMTATLVVCQINHELGLSEEDAA
jgi:hypothetical protein